MSATHDEQLEALERISSMSSLPELNKEMFRCFSSIEHIKREYFNVFEEITLLNERIEQIKKRSKEIFEIEGVKTYPDSEFTGTLTLVMGRRYIPIGIAEKELPEDVFAKLVKTGNSWVKWTPPKSYKENELE
jgi:hypothetical protein